MDECVDEGGIVAGNDHIIHLQEKVGNAAIITSNE